ncbi:substrate-binding domain-containing protein [Vibrio litoralis]|uniref:substrate-binding domain-containing protein n=1 Tax=Vibrio litoralis TaxID=335972 RepID=UPI000414B6A4|nr:substrate-binding domain-containing protein [Vibrio litoralis]
MNNTKKIILATLTCIPLLGTSVMAQELDIVNIPKIGGMPWFNRMGDGVKEAGKEYNLNAYQVGPSSTDATAQVKIIEDLIAKKVDAITIVPNDAEVLEPVFQKARKAGIAIVTNESPGQPSANWEVSIIDDKQFAQDYLDKVAEFMDGKGGYVIYVGSLTVPQHNLWADYFVQYQKEQYPDMYEVTTRMPVAENIDDSRRTTLDLMRANKDLKAVISFGSQGPIGAGRAVQDRRAKKSVGVFGMMIPSQAASLIRNGNITMGITYDPASGGYATTKVAADVINGVDIEQGYTLKGFGEAEVKKEEKLIKFHKVLFVTKDNIDQLY